MIKSNNKLDKSFKTGFDKLTLIKEAKFLTIEKVDVNKLNSIIRQKFPSEIISK